MSNRIMKKTFASALAIISAATFVPGSVIGTTIAPVAITASAEVVSGNYTYEELSDGTISITKYSGTESKVEIPVKIDGKTVTKIGNQAFMGNKNITEVNYRNDALTSIGEFAFCSCTSLKTVLIRSDASKTTIGRGAFASCTSLEDIDLICNFEAIEEGTFQRCASLTCFLIPTNVKYIGTGAFQECTNLEKVGISGTTVGKKAFYNCEKLTTIEYMSDVVDIKDYAFYGCSSLSKLSECPELETIGDYAFFGCSSLSELSDGYQSLKTIGNSAFGSCTALTELNLIPFTKLTSIGNDAFANCKLLETAVFPENLTTLGKRTFANCHALKNVELNSKKLTTIPQAAFATTGITEIKIPEGVTDIDDAAFYTCKSLTKVTLPKSVTTIGDKAFGACTSLKNVVYNGTKAQLAAISVGTDNKALTGAAITYNNNSSSSAYPVVTNILYNTQYHQFQLTWSPVQGAQNYGIAVYLAGRWKVQTQNISASNTTFVSPKLTPGKSYKVVVAAKVNGKWDTSNLSKRAVTVTIK